MIKATVKDGEFHFSSPLTRHRFFEQAEGKEVRLDIQEKLTSEMRKYFEGCLVPAFFYFHPAAGWETFADAREVMKLEFMPGVKTVRNPRTGETFKVAPSTAGMSKKRFTLFLEAISNWMVENGMPFEILDAEEYKRWRDENTAGTVEEIYPPLKRLKEAYDRQRI